MEHTITHSGISQNDNVGVESTARGLRTRHSPCESSGHDGTELRPHMLGKYSTVRLCVGLINRVPASCTGEEEHSLQG